MSTHPTIRARMPSGQSAQSAPSERHARTDPGDLEPAVLPLRLRQVTKQWRRAPSPVLDTVDLDLPAGSLTWIGGRNGVGKTTLLRIASGVITPDAGSVRALDLDPERRRRDFQSRVGFVSTGTSGLYARLTVRQHLDYQAKLDLLRRDARLEAIEREFERFDLAPIDGRRVDRLSMGQRQRLRLAMVLIRDPALLLLDEPSNSLDAEGIALLHAAVDSVVQRGGAVLWCSPGGEIHDVAFDRRLHLVDARLVEA
jgi:ABC-type multidrug transport system ATPase subunit